MVRFLNFGSSFMGAVAVVLLAVGVGSASQGVGWADEYVSGSSMTCGDCECIYGIGKTCSRTGFCSGCVCAVSDRKCH